MGSSEEVSVSTANEAGLQRLGDDGVEPLKACNGLIAFDVECLG